MPQHMHAPPVAVFEATEAHVGLKRHQRGRAPLPVELVEAIARQHGARGRWPPAVLLDEVLAKEIAQGGAVFAIISYPSIALRLAAARAARTPLRVLNKETNMRLGLFIVVPLVALVGCKKPESAAEQKPAVAAAAPSAPSATPAATGTPTAMASGALKGKVLEKIDAGAYSYLRLSTANGESWAAVPDTTVAVGTDVEVANPMVMDGFESKTLQRKFDKLFFGTLAGTQGAAPAAGHDAERIKVPKAEGPEGRTVAEVYAQKAALKDKPVVIRAKVVKATSGVMGKNWLHLRDGTGARDSKDDDLTVTTAGTAAPGDVVQVKGTVRLDRDFGSGYSYPVIIEDGTLTK